MKISKTVKSAFIFAANCWGFTIWLIWQTATEPKPEFEVTHCYLNGPYFPVPDEPMEILFTAAFLLAIGSTIALFTLLIRADSSAGDASTLGLRP